MAECVHLLEPKLDLAALAERATVCSVRGCPARADDLLVCLQPACNFIGCGDATTAHAVQHAKDMTHATMVSTRSGKVLCTVCGRQLLPDPALRPDYNARLARIEKLMLKVANSQRTSRPAIDAPTASAPAAALTTGRPLSDAEGVLVSPSERSLDASAPIASSAPLVVYPRDAGLAGLNNMGNTCFFNASVQALSNVGPLAGFFVESDLLISDGAGAAAAARSFAGSGGHGRGSPMTLAENFRDLMRQMWLNSVLPAGVDSHHGGRQRMSLPPKTLFDGLRRVNPLFEGYGQQDAHEAMRAIMNEVHDRSSVQMPVGLYTSYLNESGAAAGAGMALHSVTGADKSHARPASLGAAAAAAAAAVAADVTSGSGGVPSPQGADGPDSDEDSDAPPRQPAGPGPRPGHTPRVPFVPRPGREWLVDGPYTGPETVARSPVSDLFQGVYCSRVRCRTCCSDSVTYDTFYDLSLPIPKRQHPVTRGSDGAAPLSPQEVDAWVHAGAGKPSGPSAEGVAAGGETVAAGSSGAAEAPSAVPLVPPHPGWLSRMWCSVRSLASPLLFGADSVGLGDCLFNFCDWEPLVGADQYLCETCGCKRDADKRIGIACLPEVLCVQVKRFSFVGSWGGSGSKNSQGVAFALRELDLEPLVRISSNAHTAAVRLYTRAKEQQAGKRLVPHSHHRHAHASRVEEGEEEDALRPPHLRLGAGSDSSSSSSAAAAGPSLAASSSRASSTSSLASAGEATGSADEDAMELDITSTGQAAAAAAAAVAGVHRPAGQRRGSAAGVVTTSGHGQTARVTPPQSHVRAVVAVPSLNGVSKDAAAARAPGGKSQLPLQPHARPSQRAQAAAASDAAMELDDEPSPSTPASSSLRPGAGASPRQLAGAVQQQQAGVGRAPADSASLLKLAGGVAPASPPGYRPAAGSTGGSGGAAKRQHSEFMSVDVRAWILHRNSLATGLTGVEQVAAAANAAATGGTLSLPPAGAGAGGLAGHAVSAAAAGDCPLPGAGRAAARGARGSAPHRRPLPGPVAVPSHRITNSTRMGDCKYELASVVQHMGTVAGGHYIAHAKNRFTSKWYTFDDSSVHDLPAEEVAKKEGYLLFYVRQRGAAFPKAALPAAAPGEPVAAFVSRYWWMRYTWLSVPGPMTNADILCDHGGVKRVVADRLRDLLVGLTAEQYIALATAYGAAEPPLREVHACSECKAEALALAERRNAEKARILEVDTMRIDNEAGEVWHIISEVWLTRWRAFINNMDTADGDGTARGTLPPGPIDNARLLGKGGKPLANQKSVVHYRGVNKQVWEFLHNIYGGGPQLKRRNLDIYAEEMVDG